MSVFVDTSAFVALYYRHDAHAKSAKRVIEHLQQHNTPLVTSNYIIAESLTVISQRAGKKQAVSFGEYMVNDDFLTLRIGKSTEQRAFILFSELAQKDVSFVDCTSFILCKDLGITQVFSFDQHFAKQGFKLLKPKKG
ncbi:MAG: PIN domain-containing protein [Candidatus Andersenbacteria bacterium]